jgi:fibronectin type III domain protein
MLKLNRDQGMGRAVARKGRFVVAAALMSVLLAACGDGGGDSGGASPSAAAPPTSGGGAGGGGGGAGGGGGGGGGGASASAGAPTSSGESAPLTAVASAKGATTLSWQPPTTNDDGTPLKLTGYRIYWGLTKDNLTNSVTLDNPGLTRYVIEQLKPATYFFAATALSKDGESEPSNVIAMKVN